MTGRLAIGLGCRQGCPAGAILDVIRDACAGRDIAQARLFTHERKRREPGLRAAAAALGLPLGFVSADIRMAAAERVASRSRRVEALIGIPSVAEAAALAGAGPGGRLLVERVAHRLATCAVAVSEGLPS